mgnify:CR=1 FL=1
MVDSGFLVNSVLNMLLVVRLPSLVTESEIRVPSHLCGGDFTKLRCPASFGGEPELIKEDQKIGITNEPLELTKLLVA